MPTGEVEGGAVPGLRCSPTRPAETPSTHGSEGRKEVQCQRRREILIGRPPLIALDNYPRIQRRVEELEAQAAEARGAVKQIEKELDAKFDCKTLEQAKALLEKLGRIRRKKFDVYIAAKTEFEKKWKDRLGDVR
jgi:hypothetical protein